jgi:hypothetical protein
MFGLPKETGIHLDILHKPSASASSQAEWAPSRLQEADCSCYELVKGILGK